MAQALATREHVITPALKSESESTQKKQGRRYLNSVYREQKHQCCPNRVLDLFIVIRLFWLSSMNVASDANFGKDIIKSCSPNVFPGSWYVASSRLHLVKSSCNCLRFTEDYCAVEKGGRFRGQMFRAPLKTELNTVKIAFKCWARSQIRILGHINQNTRLQWTV